MNYAVGKAPDGHTVYMLVLEPGNLRRLREGEPISVRVEDMFPEGIPKRLELVIAWSETPIADAREMAKHAEVTLDERSAAMAKKRPKCAACGSTVEQLGAWNGDGAPITLAFCAVCGAVLGVLPASAMPK